jgi:hypothetical protein
MARRSEAQVFMVGMCTVVFPKDVYEDFTDTVTIERSTRSLTSTRALCPFTPKAGVSGTRLRALVGEVRDDGLKGVQQQLKTYKF